MIPVTSDGKFALEIEGQHGWGHPTTEPEMEVARHAMQEHGAVTRLRAGDYVTLESNWVRWRVRFVRIRPTSHNHGDKS